MKTIKIKIKTLFAHVFQSVMTTPAPNRQQIWHDVHALLGDPAEHTNEEIALYKVSKAYSEIQGRTERFHFVFV